MSTTTTFKCLCDVGYQDERCQSLVNFCTNTTCYNHGVCYPQYLNYTCQCLNDIYYGRHCELIKKEVEIHIYICKGYFKSESYLFIYETILMFFFYRYWLFVYYYFK
jgi:hypothetical protein